MKHPLDKSEWKWFILIIIMIIIMCVGFGTIMFLITREETFLIGSAILAIIFIWGRLIMPLVGRI